MRRPRGWPTPSCARRTSRSSAITMSMARLRRRLLARFLRQCGLDPIVHIPDRIFEGYGPNVDAIKSFADKAVTLLVTVDCGTTSNVVLLEAKKLGLDTVVLDHHQADEELPEAVAIVNPNRADDLSGLGYLCAAGIVFMTLVALTRELQAARFLFRRACRARSVVDARSGRARHRRRRGAAQRPQPRFRRQGPDRDAPPRTDWPDRADGCCAAERSAGSLSSRLSAWARASMPVAASGAPISACA